jgi:putative membrane protein
MDRRQLVTILAASSVAPALVKTGTARAREGSSEAEHAERTLAVGAIALETSKLAQSMAKDDWVKRFANYEVAEQTTIAEILASMGAKPPKDQKASEMVEKLKKSSSFDADYVSGQLDGHQELLKIQDDYISAGKKLPGVDVAKLARAQIKEHIDLLQTIQKNLKS